MFHFHFVAQVSFTFTLAQVSFTFTLAQVSFTFTHKVGKVYHENDNKCVGQ